MSKVKDGARIGILLLRSAKMESGKRLEVRVLRRWDCTPLGKRGEESLST